MVKPVTIVMAYFMNASMLRRHVETWATFPDEIASNLKAIIVDDCSPDKPAIEVLADMAHPFPIKLFRIEEKRRWNWLACRNIAMKETTGEWHLLTDADHLVLEKLATSLITKAHDSEKVYKLSRREHTGEQIKSHSNSYFMTKRTYWAARGHDESFSGHYGSDGDYQRRIAETAPVVLLSDELIRYEYVGDSSTTVFERKTKADAEHRRKVLAARSPGWQPKVLTFPYHEVAL